jgi:hypothetical protein
VPIWANVMPPPNACTEQAIAATYDRLIPVDPPNRPTIRTGRRNSDAIWVLPERRAPLVAWFGLLESGGELVGVVGDFLCGARHRDHLRYFGRAACETQLRCAPWETRASRAPPQNETSATLSSEPDTTDTPGLPSERWSERQAKPHVSATAKPSPPRSTCEERLPPARQLSQNARLDRRYRVPPTAGSVTRLRDARVGPDCCVPARTPAGLLGGCCRVPWNGSFGQGRPRRLAPPCGVVRVGAVTSCADPSYFRFDRFGATMCVATADLRGRCVQTEARTSTFVIVPRA